ncbi:FG-GAP repeat protein [Planctomycetes bacterium Pan216]|uniref:FG-GAP repeat protein n=1 Tax=Kolteria novifilia TaxID=2527975 RepID=A0A518BD32_9BACT|nr:FG-GAP repeat protein [Planctomycetes bacterium Pan216]
MERFVGFAIVALFVSTLQAAAPTSEGDSPPIRDYSLKDDYGFLSPEIYKLDPRIKNLLLRDIDGDGKLDIIVINNQKNRIDVLKQRPDGKPIPTADPFEVNDIPNDARLEHVKLTQNKTIASLTVGDVNNDGRADLVYLADPSGLYVEYQNKDGSFGRRRHFDISDAQRSVWALDLGDLNGDGLTDIAFLGRNNLYVAYQGADGRLKEPVRYRLDEGSMSLVRVLDLDQDGLNDIVYLSDDSQFPVRVRFQRKSHRLGPERRFEIDEPRGVSYADLDGKPGLEMLMISALSDRFLVYSLGDAAEEEESPTSQMVVFPFARSGGSPQVDLVVADVTADAKKDVVVCDASAARLLLYRQDDQEGLDLGSEYPSLIGTSLLRSLSLGDGPETILSLSERERAIGQSRFDGRRITFPSLLGTKDVPLTMAVLGSGMEARLVYLAQVRDEKASKDSFVLRKLKPTKDGDSIRWESDKFGDKEEQKLDMSGKPYDSRAVDVNADGHLDLMFFYLFQSPQIYLGNEKGTYTKAPDSTGGALGTISPAAVYYGKLAGDDPVFLVAQSNFARSLKLKNGRWEVLDQYNATEGSAKVIGVHAIDLDGDGDRELAMYDRSSQSLVFLKADNGLFRRWRTLKVGAFALRGMEVADLDGDNRGDLLLFDSEKMGISFVGKRDRVFKEIASYESNIPDGQLFDMIPGDLNANGKTDVLLLEPSRHHLEILAVGPDVDLKRAQRWQVFEEKTFRSGAFSGGGLEPREVVIGDVNSDGREDIVLVTHDRILIYIQDPGEPKVDEQAGAKKSSNGDDTKKKADAKKPLTN